MANSRFGPLCFFWQCWHKSKQPNVSQFDAVMKGWREKSLLQWWQQKQESNGHNSGILTRVLSTKAIAVLPTSFLALQVPLSSCLLSQVPMASKSYQYPANEFIYSY